MSECKGAFGAFDQQNMAGAVAAISQFAGATPVSKTDPKKGWTGGAIGDHPLKLVGVGCGDDTADTVIKETRRLMEQLDADVMIGPLSGDESIAVANYAKQHPDKTFVDGSAGAQDTTLKVQAPNFFRFNGDGAQWNAGLGDHRLQQARLEDRRGRGRRLQLRLDVGSRVHRGVLRGGRPGHEADLPAAEHDRLLVLRAADAHRRRRRVRRGRRSGSHPVPEGVRAGTRARSTRRSSRATCSGAPRASSSSSARAWRTRTSAAQARPAIWTRPRHRTTRTNIIGKWFTSFKPGGDAAAQASSTFTYGYYVNAWALVNGLEAVKGDISDQSKLQSELAKMELPAPYGKITLDDNRQAVLTVFDQQLYLKDSKLAVKTVKAIPDVDQTFGGTFGPDTPPPGRKSPTCEKRDLPWVGQRADRQGRRRLGATT